MTRNINPTYPTQHFSSQMFLSCFTKLYFIWIRLLKISHHFFFFCFFFFYTFSDWTVKNFSSLCCFCFCFSFLCFSYTLISLGIVVKKWQENINKLRLISQIEPLLQRFLVNKKKHDPWLKIDDTFFNQKSTTTGLVHAHWFFLKQNVMRDINQIYPTQHVSSQINKPPQNRGSATLHLSRLFPNRKGYTHFTPIKWWFVKCFFLISRNKTFFE